MRKPERDYFTDTFHGAQRSLSMDPLWGRLTAHRKQTLSRSSSLAPTLQFEVAYLSGVGGTPCLPSPPLTDVADICIYVWRPAVGRLVQISQDAGYQRGFPGQMSLKEMKGFFFPLFLLLTFNKLYAEQIGGARRMPWNWGNNLSN